MDAISIASQPYNSANTLANSVGHAIWNGTLFYKSGTLWKYSSNNANYTPCGGWSTDIANLRCHRDYLYDSGWQYIASVTYSLYYNSAEDNHYISVWDSKSVPTRMFNRGKPELYEGYTYYLGAKYGKVCNRTTYTICHDVHYIKRTQNRTEYKAFSSF